MAKNDPWIENRRHVRNYPHGRSVHIPRSVLRSLLRVCRNCGETNQARLVIDHIVPTSLDNRVENLQVLCRKCHREKTPADSPYAPFLRYDASTRE